MAAIQTQSRLLRQLWESMRNYTHILLATQTHSTMQFDGISVSSHYAVCFMIGNEVGWNGTPETSPDKWRERGNHHVCKVACLAARFFSWVNACRRTMRRERFMIDGSSRQVTSPCKVHRLFQFMRNSTDAECEHKDTITDTFHGIVEGSNLFEGSASLLWWPSILPTAAS